jgi:Asp-tRNA(Asn)/Glu-tRNA(Gln) amidotransferase A subunit family amidase
LTSKRLTTIYLDRLKKYGPMLRCVVNLTEDLALRQAERADREIDAGQYRGPLHGIPWGAKDLISVPGYPTTWGIPQFENRVLEQSATIVQRLEDAGAVLVAKTSLGAIAMGDVWFKGMTRNPWNAKSGSSGSSAGSASATVAGLVGFSIGSETLGSITTPSRICGATGFRPTFGRVSRHGCMPLSWTMDKIGPICRNVEDCALVFAAIHGADGLDPTAESYPFEWPPATNVCGMRVGYTKSRRAPDDRADLRVLRELGCELVEIVLPNDVPVRALVNVINIEGASVFEAMLKRGETDGWNAWTNIFRAAQFVSAVDYVKLMRLRTQLMRQFENVMSHVDALCNVFDIYHGNLAGHPSVVIPREFRELRSGGRQPITTAFTGHLNQDERLLALARAVQLRGTAHLMRPPLDDWLKSFQSGELDQPSESDKPATQNADESSKPGGN